MSNPKIYFSRVEPVGSVSPKINVGDEYKILRVKMSNSVNILCPAQSYPVPFYRWVIYFVL